MLAAVVLTLLAVAVVWRRPAVSALSLLTKPAPRYDSDEYADLDCRAFLAHSAHCFPCCLAHGMQVDNKQLASRDVLKTKCLCAPAGHRQRQ